MNQRQKLAGDKWISLRRQILAGKLDYLLPIFGNRSQIGLAIWNETYAHLCKFPGLAKPALREDEEHKTNA